MPGDSSLNFSLLHRTCKLVVLLCFLHISVTVVFYVRSLDIRFAFVQNQQSHRTQAPPDRPPGTPASTAAGARGHNTTAGILPECPETSPLLVGPLRVEFNMQVSLEQIRRDNPQVRAGGRFRPAGCRARHKVAVIIPFRNREEHLKYWLHYLHPILQRQQLDYGVYIINQAFLTNGCVRWSL